jgi:hypothetical protein
LARLDEIVAHANDIGADKYNAGRRDALVKMFTEDRRRVDEIECEATTAETKKGASTSLNGGSRGPAGSLPIARPWRENSAALKGELFSHNAAFGNGWPAAQARFRRGSHWQCIARADARAPDPLVAILCAYDPDELAGQAA